MGPTSIRQDAREAAGTEETWWLNEDWEEVTSPLAGGSWDHVWLVVRADFVEDQGASTLRVTDLKTGRVREESHLDQLRLYATAALSVYEVDRVISRALYSDHGLSLEQDHDVCELAPQQRFWAERARPLFEDDTFEAKPGDHCRWCYQAKGRGGQCRYG